MATRGVTVKPFKKKEVVELLSKAKAEINTFCDKNKRKIKGYTKNYIVRVVNTDIPILKMDAGALKTLQAITAEESDDIFTITVDVKAIENYKSIPLELAESRKLKTVVAFNVKRITK